MAADDSFERRLATGLHDLLDGETPPHPTWSDAPAAQRPAGRPILVAGPRRGAVWLLVAAVLVALVGTTLAVAGGRLPLGPTAVLTPSPTASPTFATPSTSPTAASPSPSPSRCTSSSGSLSIVTSGPYPGPTSVDGVSVVDGSTAIIRFDSARASAWMGLDLTVGPVSPPFTRDPSDLPVTVGGRTFLKIVLRGVYGNGLPASALDQHADGTLVTELVETGDFEGVQTWIVGLTGPVCVNTQGVLGGPSVLVTLTTP